MMIDCDPAKNARNISLRGISLWEARELLSGFRVEFEDRRFDYGETRIIAIGEIKGLVFTCVYTLRDDMYRVISLRPASRKERNVYHQEKGG
jgi:uncharacterized DUF497 family protein